jgi:hypothetical protein
MAKLSRAGACLRSASWLAATACVLCPLSLFARSHKKSAPPEPRPVRATVKPSVTIPIEPLGLTEPALFYLGTRNSLVSLDFLDEDRLLLTFRVPGLIHRDHNHPAGSDSEERRIRAVVFDLPGGAVEAESLWTLHDRRRYLWMLDGGLFLLRDRDQLEIGDASLQLKPYLRFPGPVLWIEMDPNRKYLVAGSYEPPMSASRAGGVSGPGGGGAPLVGANDPPGADPDLVLRVLRRDSGKVMVVSHVKSAVHLPINAEGYLDTVQDNSKSWMVNLNHFGGGNTPIGSVDSYCSPELDFISRREFLATTCESDGSPRVLAMTTEGRRLWDNNGSGSLVWPILVTGANGLRFARETLIATHDVTAFAPLGSDDIKGQDVQVIDAATGKVVLRAMASPTFDAGGNAAISPSGRRVAIIMAEGIQVFELPPPPPLTEETPGSSRH